ncbi:MAG: DUF3489 domain-containing protein [Proteobacteria bacterium]|nr:DUF3489 domain-containing protein [Pseudomonadota bacterium]
MKTKTEMKAKAPAKRKAAKSRSAKTKPAARAAAAKSDDAGGAGRGAKVAAIAALLQRPNGCTTKDILDATGWPTVSVPAQAKAAGLKLTKTKDGRGFRYHGTPLKAAA